jgi:hypothetical protein
MITIPNRLRAPLAGATIALLAFGAAPPPTQDWSSTIETVVVTADRPGPALWHAVKGNSEVWILPTVSPVPKDMRWDSSAIAAQIKGANILITPPGASVGVLEGTWFLLTGLGSLEQPDGTTLESTLPEPLKSRFVAMRARIHQDPDRYDDLLGSIAALRLESDYWDFARLTPNGPQKEVERLASHAGVHTQMAAEYPAMDVVHDVPKMSAAAHRACMQFALDDIDTEIAHAWSIGDLAGIKAHYSDIKLDDCLQQSSVYSSLRERAIRDTTNAILAALNKPGKSFAVLPMGLFLRKGTVLDRLEAAGVTISRPGG